MNSSETKKIITAACLMILVLGAVAYMVFGSRQLLTLKQPKVGNDTVLEQAATSSFDQSGAVLGDSVENPLRDIYVNPFAK